MEEEELFKIDVDCDEHARDENEKAPKYYVDHCISSSADTDETVDKRTSKDSSFTESCWNCNKAGHSIRDCPLPPNRQNINQNKKNFNKMQTFSKRYHDNKFAKFRPGHHSSKLREALGLRPDDVPEHVYMMRILGYPPGWLAEAKITNSGIKMYNSFGKRIPEPDEEDGEILNKVMKYDVDKLIEFPGFNVPLKKGLKDRSRALGYPPMKSEHAFDNFIEYLRESSHSVEGDSEESTDDEVADMEMSEMLPTKIIEEVKIINKRILQINSKRCSSDSRSSFSNDALEEGELDSDRSQTKSKDSESGNRKRNFKINIDGKSIENIHTYFDDESTQSKRRKSPESTPSHLNGMNTEDIEDGELQEDDDDENLSDEIALKDKSNDSLPSSDKLEIDILNSETKHITEKVTVPHCEEETIHRTPDQTNSSSSFINRSSPINIVGRSTNEDMLSTPSPRGSVTSTSFGTPDIKSHSSYSSLPSFENFNKDISDVIDFENLPDSVGKYQSMCSIISKIRSFMTSKFSKSAEPSKEK